MSDLLVHDFLQASSQWVCDDYSLDARYLASTTESGYEILDASVSLHPLPLQHDNSLRLSVVDLVAGQVQYNTVDKRGLLTLLGDAASGTLNLHDLPLVLPRDSQYQIQSTLAQRGSWYSPLYLQITGRSPTLSPDRLGKIDNALRAFTPPFDGLSDLSGWLGLRAPGSGYLSSIALTVPPPADIIVDQSQLLSDRMRLTIHAHPRFDVRRIMLAVRGVPGDGLRGRIQASDRITWGDVQTHRREGIAEVEVPNADGALAMLMIGPDTVRRHWFLDPNKAANHRLVAVQEFDKDLRMIKQGLFDVPDGAKFEKAVAALGFLLGFAPMMQLETDSPDLVLATPRGRLAIVECTIRVADIVAKIGKLVARRGALARSLQGSSYPGDLVVALVCRLPRQQIVAHSDFIQSSGVILVAAEELNEALSRVRFRSDPDLMLSQVQQDLAHPTRPT